MATYVRTPPSHRRTKTTAVIARPAAVARTIKRTDIAVPAPRQHLPATAPALPSNGFQPDPYLDYGRALTAEGGILIAYKDIDQRWRHTLWRLFAWTVATVGETCYLLGHAPLHNDWINFACIVVMGVVNWLIVAKPVEVYRNVEIRPDCLILDSADIFWVRHMSEMPAFRADEDGNQVLCGTYGTRHVEYLTARRFDENDRMPETFAAHMRDAMQQLWTKFY